MTRDDRAPPSPPGAPLRVLVLEDLEEDAELLVRALRRAGLVVEWRREETAAGFARALDEERWDIVVSDYSMPSFTAKDAYELLCERGQDLPFIIVSGTVGEEAAVEAMREGVHDYVVKGRLARLAPAVVREVREARLRAERRALEQQILVADRLAALGALAAGVAHEVNNPLAAVLASLEVVERRLERLRGQLPVAEGATGEAALFHSHLDSLAPALAGAREAAERVRLIARDLRTYGRPDDEPVGVVDLGDVLDAAIRMALPQIRGRARLVREGDAIPPVLGSPLRFGQVFLNLLLNAAQAIPDEDPELHAVTVRAARDGRFVEVCVSDTGRGIPQDVLPRIFDPFFTTKGRAGTGLGLAVSQRIVAAFGGVIRAESPPGQGATFRVRLPEVEAHAAFG